MFNEYHEILSSKEHRECAPLSSSTFNHDCGLVDADIDEFLGETRAKESCRAEQITDKDVMDFVKRSKRLEYLDELQEIIRSSPVLKTDMNHAATTQDKEISSNSPSSVNKNRRPRPEFVDRSPPRKVLAQQSSEPSSTTSFPSKKDDAAGASVIENINRCFLGNKHLVQPSTSNKEYKAWKSPVSQYYANKLKTQETSSGSSSSTTVEPRRAAPADHVLNTSFYGDSYEQLRFRMASDLLERSSVTKRLGGRFVHRAFKSPCPLEVVPEAIKIDQEKDDPLLKGIDPKLLDVIKNEIIDLSADLSWDDIAGLGEAKKTIQEAVILPLLRPDLFIGLRSVPKGILLFGPPGNISRIPLVGPLLSVPFHRNW